MSKNQEVTLKVAAVFGAIENLFEYLSQEIGIPEIETCEIDNLIQHVEGTGSWAWLRKGAHTDADIQSAIEAVSKSIQSSIDS